MSSEAAHTEYTVLARKYRPQTFADLIGQEVLVTTLRHAIEQQRFANAYLLTGIRGVGKTSTARIIAKALNCLGPDGTATQPQEPCGTCAHCTEIARGAHVDVLEMDAASRTGVGDIREIIDNVQYLPSSGRFKVYIIDEVHMLSKNAFNALLKTLEEPPARVKFIFATTEVRKVPITVLSRCQRFDLPRIHNAELVEHLKKIAAAEAVQIDTQALESIVRLSEGSVRDALSLLDQVIGHAGSGQEVHGAEVNAALGLVGKDGIYDVFDAIVKGNTEHALDTVGRLYHQGSDPVLILQDLAECCHMLSKAKVVKNYREIMELSEPEQAFVERYREPISVAVLARLWQMIHKGLEEMRYAPNALLALEMIIIRITYTAQLPTPGDLVKKFEKSEAEGGVVTQPATQHAPAPQEPAPVSAAPQIADFEALVQLFKTKGEAFLYNWLRNELHLVKFEPGRLEVRLGKAAPRDLPAKIMAHLKDWTGERWLVIVSNEAGHKTLSEKAEEQFEREKQEAIASEPIQALLNGFPGAKVGKVYRREVPAAAPLPPVSEEGQEPIDNEVLLDEKRGEQL